MKLTASKRIRSSAIGERIRSLRYDADGGYVVITLESGDELWVRAD